MSHQGHQALDLRAADVHTGTLTRDFKHLAVDMYLKQVVPKGEEDQEKTEKRLIVDCHFGKRKRLAAIRTCCSHVQVRQRNVVLLPLPLCPDDDLSIMVAPLIV